MLRELLAYLAKRMSVICLRAGRKSLWLSQFFADAETWLSTADDWTEIRAKRSGPEADPDDN